MSYFGVDDESSAPLQPMRANLSRYFTDGMSGAAAQNYVWDGRMAGNALGVNSQLRATRLEAEALKKGSKVGAKSSGFNWGGALGSLAGGLAGMAGGGDNFSAPFGAGNGVIKDSSGVLRGTLGPNYGIRQ